MQQAAPGHVVTVRQYVIDALTDQLTAIGDAILARLDPTGSMAATYTRYDPEPEPLRSERVPDSIAADRDGAPARFGHVAADD